jgi:outer membrane protein TolC
VSSFPGWLDYLTTEERQLRDVLEEESSRLFNREAEISAEIKYLQALAQVRKLKGGLKSSDAVS